MNKPGVWKKMKNVDKINTEFKLSLDEKKELECKLRWLGIGLSGLDDLAATFSIRGGEYWRAD